MTVTKPIPISNADAINAAITEAEGRATARTLSGSDIELASREAETSLSVLPKRLWRGTQVLIAPHRVPNNYEYRAQATVALIVRRSHDWALTDVRRTYADNTSHGVGRPHATLIALPPTVDREALLDAFLRNAGISIAPDVQGRTQES